MWACVCVCFFSQTNFHKFLWFSHKCLWVFLQGCRCHRRFLFLQVWLTRLTGVDTLCGETLCDSLWLFDSLTPWLWVSTRTAATYWAWQQQHALFINIMTQTNCHTICQQTRRAQVCQCVCVCVWSGEGVRFSLFLFFMNSVGFLLLIP